MTTKAVQGTQRIPVWLVAVVMMTVLIGPGQATSTAYQQHRFVASDAEPRVLFGYDVALHRDHVLIGARGADENRGAAYLYEKGAGGAWQETRLESGTPTIDGYFGWSVALSGTQRVVGAPWEDSGRPAAGKVYVWSLIPHEGWVRQAIAASDAATLDSYGHSVAVHGDAFVVGATQRLNDGIGKAYLYTPTGHLSWSETILSPSIGAADDMFGHAVAMAEDMVIVGAPGQDVGATNTGAVFVYTWTGTGWSETRLLAADRAAGDKFGYDVDISGDRIIVGTASDEAYVFTLTGGRWMQQRFTGTDGFGQAVAIDGDRAVITAWGDDTATGAAHLYTYEQGVWTSTKFRPVDATQGDHFGDSVDIHGAQVLGGAPQWGDLSTRPGTAWLFQAAEQPTDYGQDDGGTGGDASDDPNDPTPAPVGTNGFGLNGTLAPSTDTVDAYELTFGTSADEIHLDVNPPVWADLEVLLVSPSSGQFLFDGGGIGGTEKISITGTDMESGAWTFVFTLKDIDASRAGTPDVGLLNNGVVDYHSVGRCNPQCRP